MLQNYSYLEKICVKIAFFDATKENQFTLSEWMQKMKLKAKNIYEKQTLPVSSC